MQKNLLRFLAYVLISTTSLSLHAQIKGDPAPTGPSPEQAPAKTSSRLSSDLKKLYDDNGARAKVVQSTKKPSQPDDAMNAYLQIRGDKVVVDVTVKGDLSAARGILKRRIFFAL